MSELKNYPFGKEGWTPKSLPSLKGKTYLITGANVGAGFEATKVLVSKGAKVVMLCRNAQKAEAALADIKEQFLKPDVKFILLDLASLASVRDAAEKIKKEVSQIDALICNAAVAQVAKQEMSVDGFEIQLGINHYGHFLLCGLLFDKIKASHGRIVIVSSLAYRMGLKKIQFDDLNFDNKYSPWNAYAQSKLAQMMFGYELQRRVKDAELPVQVQVCHPGAARTTLVQEEANLAMRILLKILSPLAQSAEKGSWPEVLCAAENNLETEAFYGPTKRGEMVGAIGKCKLLPHVLDPEAASKLWQVSEEKTGLKWSP